MKTVPAREYIHPSDQKTMRELEQIPGFSKVLKSFSKTFTETLLHGLNMGQKVRLGPDQLPEVYNLLPPLCERLGISPIPALYLESSPYPNAYTSGDSIVFITITAGLLHIATKEQLTAILAHECGHIACHHVLYHTMGDMLLTVGSDILGLGALSIPLRMAMFHWMRMSELSCDRAAAVCMESPWPMVDGLITVSGGNMTTPYGEVSRDAFVEQSSTYSLENDESMWKNSLQNLYVLTSNLHHPFTAVRTNELTKWCEGDHYKRLIDKLQATGDDGLVCPVCGSKMQEDWQFCRECGAKNKA